MATVDSLDIQISASAQSASKSINDLVGKLNTLSKSLKIDTKPMEEMRKSASEIAAELKENLKGIDVKIDFSKPEAELKKFQRQAENAQNALTRILASSDADKQIPKIEKWTIALSQANNAIQQLENKLENIAKEKLDYPKSDLDVSKYGETAEHLASVGAFRELKEYIDELKNSTQKATESTREFEGTWNGIEIPEFLTSGIKKSTDTIREKIQEISEKYKEVGKDFIFEGNLEQLENQINKLNSELEKLYGQRDRKIDLGEIDTKSFEPIIYDIQRITNQLEILENYRPEALNKTLEENAEKARIAAERLKELGASLEKLEVPTIREENIDKLYSSLDKTEAKLEELRTKLANGLTMGRITVSADDSGFVKLQEQIALMEKTAEALKEKIQKVEGILSQEAVNTSESLSAEERSSAETAEVMSILEANKKSASKANKDLGDQAKKTAKELLEEANKSKTFEKLNKTTSKMAKAFSSVYSKTISFAKGFGNIKKANENANNSFSNSLKTILKYGFGIRSLYILFNKLRSAITDGMKNLVRYSDETNQSVSMLMNSLNQLKNAAAAAASPIFNAIAPALNYLIEMCVAAANAINQLFSAITGHGTWIRAKKQSDDYASSLESASGAAEDLYNTTLGIDELNINAGEKNKGGSGTGTNIEDMFETVPIDSDISDFAKKINDAWKSADFTEIGKILGTKLKNALDSIDWDSIKETAAKIGKSIATLINGIVEVDGLADSIGRTIGEAINTGIVGINAFLDNTHWDSVGIFIGEGLNGIVNTIDWEELGHLFAAKWNAIFEVLGNAATTFKWSKFGTKLAASVNTFIADFEWAENGARLGELAKGLLDSIISFLENTDWQALGNGIADFIGGVDWGGILERLAEGIGAALGGLAALLWGLIEDAWNSVVEWWQETAFEDGQFTITGLLNGIWEGVKNIDSWIIEHIFQPFVDGFKKAFGIHSPSTVMAEQGAFIVTGLLQGLTDTIGLVLDWVTEKADKIIQYFSGIFSPDIWYELMQGVKAGLTLKWEEIVEWWQNTALFTWWEENVAPWFDTEKWYETADGIKTGISKKWDEHAKLWITNITKWWNTNVAPWFTIEKWKTLGENMKEGIYGGFKGIASKTVDVLNGIISGFESMVNKVVDMVNDLIEKINDSLGPFIPDIPKIKFKANFGRIEVPAFANGGFPEDGLFYANHNELVGQFSGGKTAVANNEMIVAGIEEAAYRGFTRAYTENTRETDLLQELISAVREGKTIEVDGRELVSIIDERKMRNGYAF